MATYNTAITRGAGGASPDALVPQPFAAQVIEELPQASVLLNRARRVTMSANTYRQPVLTALPTAYWVTGDNGLKQTATQEWNNVNLVAEELAALVPVPNAYMDDAQVPIWDEVRPRLVEAIGRAFDEAGLFGVNKPASWTSDDVYTAAVAAGNEVTSQSDVGISIAELGTTLAKQGYAASGFASAPGFGWNLVGVRGSNGQPIYWSDPANPNLKTLYGYSLDEVMNGAFDATKASLIAADWSKVVVGVRQDITFSIHEDGIVSDDTGKVIYNAMQQDSTILRVVFRGAYATAKPVTQLNKGMANKAPFAVLSPIAALS
jgi:HK97 family phage major capsid protein